MDLLTPEELKKELDIQEKYGIKDIVVTSRLGMTILADLLRRKNFCRMCKKNFSDILPDTDTHEARLKHMGEHFESDFRATQKEFNTYVN